MLHISKPLSTPRMRIYHARDFSAPWQGYWRGQLAEKFGLVGLVGAEEFLRLAEGRHPQTGDQLILYRFAHEYKTKDNRMIAPMEHIAGWDVTCNAPKSVSLTALVGGDNRVCEAHRVAANAALTELERYTRTYRGRNGAVETTGRFAAATFEHDTARPVDGYAAPHLHTHAVIFNMTEREDGATRALNSKGLFENQCLATYVYRSHLMYMLRTFGYEIESGRSGAPEIKGYSQEYLEASSPRRRQIDQAVARSGFWGPEGGMFAAYNTRDEKQILPPTEIRSAHMEIAAKFGNQADNVVANARSRRLYQARDWTVEERQKQAHFALTYVRDRSFERQDLIDERTLFVNAMRRGMGETTYQELRPNFEARVASGEFRLVRSGEHDSVRLFTTAQTIEAEREIIQRVLDGRSRALQLLSIERAIPLTESQRYLNRAERGVVEQILTSRDQVQGFQRGRGFEKTGLLRVIGEGAEQNGYRVEGFAETPRAARMHRDTEIPFDTLRGFLMRDLRPADALRQKHLYIVDESSLASTFEVREFLNRISRQDKVLFIGDIRHYQGVGAELFEQLHRAGMQTAKLDQIASQQNVQHSKSSIERSGEALQPIIVPNRTETSGLGLAI